MLKYGLSIIIYKVSISLAKDIRANDDSGPLHMQLCKDGTMHGMGKNHIAKLSDCKDGP